MVLFLLWKGLARYMAKTGKRYLFGCCSLNSQDPVEGKRVMDHLEATGFVLPDLRIPPNPRWRCYEPGFELPADAPTDEVQLPKLFRTYLRYGAKVCSDPAIDRDFKTIDYLVLFDLENLDAASRAMFFGERGAR
jgi:putative hemolysin